MRSRDTDIIVVPGLGGSGSDHWQARWQAKLPNAHRVEQADWDHPRLDEWIEALARTVQRCERPVVLIAHSLGATTVAHAADRGLIEVAGAFLVAPPGRFHARRAPGHRSRVQADALAAIAVPERRRGLTR